MQHSDELLAIWRAKITSREQLEAAYEASERLGLYPNDATRYVYQTLHGTDGVRTMDFNSNDLWPASRDAVREHLGIYEQPTSVLLWLRHIGFMYQYPHVSREDTSMVAYSADTAGATNDNKVRISIGRLLRKLLPQLSDEQVAKLSATHAADIDPNFQIASTPEEIESVYRNMSGDTGCMRYATERFNHEVYHPSAVYSSPGLGVAYMGTLDNPTARCVIYTNPDNPEDKRYVRIYGNPVLANKLKRNGYRMAGLAGARIKRLHDPDLNSSYIVMPYIDPPGGRGSGEHDCAAQHVVSFRGEDFVTLVTEDHVNALSEFGIVCQGVATTEGHISLRENSSTASLELTDAVTGEPINLLTATSSNLDCVAVERDGTLKVGWTVNADLTADWMAIYVMADNGALKRASVAPDVYERWNSPVCGGYARTPATMQHLGLYELDPARYGEGQYARESECVRDSSGLYVRRSDSIMTFNADGAIVYVPSDQEDDLRNQGYVPTPNRDGIKVLAHPDCPTLVTLVSGRRAIRGLHDIVVLVDGRFCMRDSANPVSILGQTGYMSGAGFDFDLPASYWERRAEHSGADWPLSDYTLLNMMRKTIKCNGTSSHVPTVDHHSNGTWHINLAGIYDISSTRHTLPRLIESAEWLLAHEGEVHDHSVYAEQIIHWSKCALSLHRAVMAARAAMEAPAQEAAPTLQDQADDALLEALNVQMDSAMAANTATVANTVTEVFNLAALDRARALLDESFNTSHTAQLCEEMTRIALSTLTPPQIVRLEDTGAIYSNAA